MLFCLGENPAIFKVMVPQSIPIRQSSMRNNMSSELESTRKRVCHEASRWRWSRRTISSTQIKMQRRDLDFLVQMVFPHGLQRSGLFSVTVVIGNPVGPYFSCSMAVPIPSRQFSGFILDSRSRSATLLF